MTAGMKIPTKTFWLRVIRALIFLYAIAVIGISLAGAVMFPAYARKNPEHFLALSGWTKEQEKIALDQLGAPVTLPAYVDMARFSLMLLIGASLGLLLLWRKPDSLFSLFLAFVFISFSAGDTFFSPVQGRIPALQLYTNFMGGAGWQFYFIVFFLFPDGKPVPGWTRWMVVGWLAMIGIELIVGNDFFFKYGNIANPIFTIMALSAVISQVYRYFRRSDPVQRQQTRWVFLVMVLLIIDMVFDLLLGFKAPAGKDLGASLILALGFLLVFSLVISLFPLAVTVAIFRYRLWDIDLVIRRTLVYAVLTTLLGLVYFGLVTLIQGLFAGVSQQQSPLALVISTLVIAALFTPLRRRIQQIIDRRFFRQRYDAATTLDNFSQNLRSQVELPAIQQELADVVSETIQPASLSLWIRKVEKP
jgi:hypothetical protein